MQSADAIHWHVVVPELNMRDTGWNSNSIIVIIVSATVLWNHMQPSYTKGNTITSYTLYSDSIVCLQNNVETGGKDQTHLTACTRRLVAGNLL